MVARPGGRHSGGMNIFLVEDSGPVRERLAEMLSAIPGATLVGTADEADAAIRGILTARPEVVVLDISLGGGSSGFDVPGRDETELITALEAIPGAVLGIAAVYAWGARREDAVA